MRAGERGADAEDEAGGDEPEAAADDEPKHVAPLRAERDADADLLGALGDEVGDDAVEPDHGEHERQRREQAHQCHLEARLRHRVVDQLIHAARVEHRLRRVELRDGALDGAGHGARLAAAARDPVQPREGRLRVGRIDGIGAAQLEALVFDVVERRSERGRGLGRRR